MLVPVSVVSPTMSRIRSDANLENSRPLPDNVVHKLRSVREDGAGVAALWQPEHNLGHCSLLRRQ